MNQGEIASHLDVNTRTVRDLRDRGVIDLGKPIDEIRVAYIRHLRALAANQESSNGLRLIGERARLAKELADGRALQNAVARGELVSSLDAQSLGASFAAGVAQRVLGLRTLAPLIRSAETDEEGASILEEGARDALSEVARMGDAVAELSRRAPRTPGRTRR